MGKSLMPRFGFLAGCFRCISLLAVAALATAEPEVVTNIFEIPETPVAVEPIDRMVAAEVPQGGPRTIPLRPAA